MIKVNYVRKVQLNMFLMILLQLDPSLSLRPDLYKPDKHENFYCTSPCDWTKASDAKEYLNIVTSVEQTT